MALKVEEKKIGEDIYVVTQLGAQKGRKVLFRLSRILGPVSAGLFTGGLSQNSLIQAAGQWAEHASEEDFDYFCETFSGNTMIKQTLSNGEAITKPLNFDTHFAGKYGDMVVWLTFCIKVNFNDFLSQITSEAKPLLDALGIRKRSSLKSQE